MSIKYYVLGGPRYKPPGVSKGSPRLHFILMCMLIQLFVCCDLNKVQFDSQWQDCGKDFDKHNKGHQHGGGD